MPAYFENGVFTENKAAWHGQGIVVEDDLITADRILELVPEFAAPVVKVPLLATHVTDDGDVDVIDVDDHYATVRMSDTVGRKVLGVVGSRYTVVQNDELLDFGEAIIAREGEAVWRTAGSIYGGRTVWGLLDLGDLEVAGEEWKRYLMATNSHDGSRSLEAVVTSTRVVCANTWNVALNGAPRRFSLRHTESIKGRAEEAARTLQIAARFDVALKALADDLVKRPMTSSSFDAFARDLIPLPEDEDRKAARTIRTGKISDLTHVWSQAENLDAIRGTAWGAIQATIEWQQRYAYPDRVPDARVAKVLTDSQVNARALEILTA